MNVKQEISINGVEVRFWMIKTAPDDIDVMAEMDNQEPVKVIRLRPDGKVGLYKIENRAYPFTRDSQGYIAVR